MIKYILGSKIKQILKYNNTNFKYNQIHFKHNRINFKV